MSIKYNLEHDIETVFALLTDPDFIVDRSLALGELEASCEVDQREDSTVVTMTRKLERQLPRFLARMMDPEQTMHISERWRPDGEGGWTGQYTFEVEAQPVSIGAHFELYATDSGCCYSIVHRASATIPLVGKRIEKFILAQAEQGCTAEFDYLAAKLC